MVLSEQLIDCTRMRNRLGRYRRQRGGAMRVDALWMRRRNVRKERKEAWEQRDRYKY